MSSKKIIAEGRKEDFIKKYSNKFPKNQLDTIVNSVKPKYLDWVGKNIDQIGFDERLQKLLPALANFEKISSNLPLTDLYQYKSIDQLISSLTEYNNRKRRDIKKVKGGNVVYDDGRFFIVNPLTHDSSCYYGKGTKWCTTTQSDDRFNQYNTDGKLFYVLDRKLPTNDDYYKVAILKKFDGDEIYYDAKDNSFRSGWILNTDKMNEIKEAMDEYIKTEFAEQVKIYTDKEAAKKEREKNEKIRIQRIKQQKLAVASSRREDNEWELGPDCPEEGLKAHALLEHLESEGGADVLTNEDKIERQRIQDEIDRLNAEYDQDENVRTDLLDEISDLEDQLEEYENKIDVYNLYPLDYTHYDLTMFEVLGDNEFEGQTFAVGDSRETEDAAHEYVKSLIDDVGYEGFRESFVEGFIDEDQVKSTAESFYEDDIRDYPEGYFDDEDKMLSDEQEEEIRVIEFKIQKIEKTIEFLESEIDDENEDEINEKIETYQEEKTELEEEKEEIESSPDGDFPEDLIQDKIDDLVHDATRDPKSFLLNYGFDLKDYIDKDALIEGVISEDGYGTLSPWDGTEYQETIENITYSIFRID